MLWIYCWFILINLPGDNEICLDFHHKNDLFEFIWSYPAKKILLLKIPFKKDLCFYRWSFLIVWNTNLRCSTAHYSWTNFFIIRKELSSTIRSDYYLAVGSTCIFYKIKDSKKILVVFNSGIFTTLLGVHRQKNFHFRRFIFQKTKLILFFSNKRFNTLQQILGSVLDIY